MTITVTDLCRYPIKGMSAEHLESVTLTVGQAFPDDRRFALAHGSTAFDPENPEWLPKSNFLMLAKNEKLAQLETGYDSDSGVLTIKRAGKQVVNAKITEPLGRTIAAQFFAGFLGEEARGAPKLVEAAGHMFSDVPEKHISIINLASIEDLERVTRRKLHPLRFRGNIMIDGTLPWSEFFWVDRTVRIGEARLKIIKRIDRCAATNVNPETAERDLNVPQDLRRGFGHIDMGVYAAVVGAGRIAPGDSLILED